MLSRTLLSHCQSLRQLQSGRHLTSRLYSGKSTKDDIDNINDASTMSELLKDAANFNESTDQSWSTTPYPKDAPSSLEKAKDERPELEPLDASILLFPGQGTLKVGMVKQYMKFPRVHDLFENANEVLGYDIKKLCLEGPQSRLNRTEFNQPATIVASLAALERLWEERPRAIESCKAVAGYSVGEITALIFSGALSIESGIKLAGIRGAAMQSASDDIPQGMLTAFCSASAKPSLMCQDAKKWALDLGIENPVCTIAVYLYTQGKIFAGNEEALNFIETNGSNFGVRQVRRIPVSGAFHTALMEPALKPFMKALGMIDLEEPRIDVYSNIDGKPYHSVRKIKKMLPKQIISPVKWEQVMHTIYQRPPGMAFPRTFDLGSNGTMKTLLKRINAKAWDFCYEL